MAKFGDLQKKYPDLEVWAHPAEYKDLYDLTVKGIKTATSSWHDSYLACGEGVPSQSEVGTCSIMLDDADNPTAEVLLQTDEIVVERFCDISERTAWANGEGDRSVEDWKKIFGEFWERTLPDEGLRFSETGLVVTEFFHVKEV
ncbi:ASCH domain-containing protein [Streptococcus himalayensis]|uniref:RNA-binding protein n=1 Tax=Streptococcus himalayensis TaxID=1888195 RepID=A0A917A4U1_9STRE|nr:ASCH domain-containing protein [Streptococcus himalayensis]GGE27534.1 RNA-binding protein [Streptococcus himalayensis]